LFAGSFVLLARAAGYPTRVVTGFRGGSWNGYSNHFTVRNSDAHAWCEIFDVSAGAWLRADATPGAAAAALQNETTDEAALAGRVDRSWTARLDSLRVFWYRRIVNFDQQSQLETLRAVKEATENSSKRLREALERLGATVKAWFAAPWDRARGVKLGAGLLLLAALVWTLRRFPFRLADFRGRGARGNGDAVRRRAGQWLARWRALGSGASGAVPRPEVVVQLERLRFGARETWPQPRAVFREAKVAWRESKRHARAER
ncbi:MAG TPA: transglutaminase-like domain-containing protein, partial [Opitutus sp.]|nr:transglutaminase-like domain-containing protein [Opitutus sp.]